MIKKEFYTPPVTETVPVSVEANFCDSGQLKNYDVYSGSVTWD
jgi:hypothetical protein